MVGVFSEEEEEEGGLPGPEAEGVGGCGWALACGLD